MPALAEKKRIIPSDMIKVLAAAAPPALDFHAALQGKEIRLIAEVKKASPSKGILRRDFNPVDIAMKYASGGAAAISVLTEEKYFLGKPQYLRDIKDALGSRVPVLRKDFIHDPYQVYEARAWGADAVLLIVAILSPERLGELMATARELGMACLVEVHNENEIDIALYGGAGIIGINNRDLNTFTVDLNTTGRLRPLIPPHITVVSESGIHTRADIMQLKNIGINAVLIGESLMTAQNIEAGMKELL